MRAADRRDEIAALIRRGAWRPPNTFELDPREKNPGFHEFASDWLKRYRRTVDALNRGQGRVPAQPPPAAVPAHLPARRDRLRRALRVRRAQARAKRGDRGRAHGRRHAARPQPGDPRRPLSPRTINMTLDLTARIFKDAVKRGLLQGNPATDRDLRLKVTQRKGNFLEADELLALIDAGSRRSIEPISKETLARAELARRMRKTTGPGRKSPPSSASPQSTAIWLAGRHRKHGQASVRRAILATLGCAGLRNSEACDLNVGDLDFAHGVIHVRDAKTEAGIRQVNMTPWLHDELLAYRATPARRASPTSPRSRPATARAATFATSTAESSRPRSAAANALRADGAKRRTSRIDHRAHLPPHLHHADARGRRAGPVRAGPGRPRGPDDHAGDLRAGAQAP